MNLVSFGQSPSGRVVRVGRGEVEYRAFVPHPLPPDLTLTPDLLMQLSQADQALGKLAGFSSMMANSQLLLRPFIHREAVLSSRIEGTQTGLTDLYAYEAGQVASPHIAVPNEQDANEVLNYVRALDYGLERLATLPISLRFVRELHEKLMRGVRGDQATPGEFRHSQNWIGPPGSTLNTATFVPPPPPDMLDALDAFEKYLHRPAEYPALIRLAFVHYQFEAIHPFLDGNGRVGRLILPLLLVHWDLLPVPLLNLSAYFERHRDRYYDLLLAVSQHGVWDEWVAFFLQAFTEQANDAIQRAAALLSLQKQWRDQFTQARSSVLLLRLIDHLFEWPILTITDTAGYLGVTYKSAQANINKLVQAEILQSSSQVYNRAFVATAVLRVIQDDPGV
ncbi:MAG: Fic family protein [Chloroflexota bacterium]|nr:Fic family protein [Chloroflexota bacterium]